VLRELLFIFLFCRMRFMVKKVIIPVAGLGTRFLPATKAQPKEMLSVVDKPVIQYLVEEAVASGITDIIFVTGRGKRAIEDHFDVAPELEAALGRKGKTEALKEVRAISSMATFAYVRQKEPRGDGDAVLCARHLVGDEPVAVLFGDDVVDAEVPCLKQLVGVYEKHREAVVALEEVPKEQVSKYGIVAPGKVDGRTYEVTGFVEKPNPADAPSNLAAVGKYIITPEIFDELERARPAEEGELRLADAFIAVCKKHPIYGYRFEGTRYDCGSKLGFLKATVEFGLRHEEVREDFEKYLKERVG
jgi:UTP--glucose-1-phosphate uridylyltransferase